LNTNKTLTKEKRTKIKKIKTKRIDSETLTQIKDKFSFLEIGQKKKGKKKERVTADKLTFFRWHTPPIKEKNMVKNKMIRWKYNFYPGGTPYALSFPKYMAPLTH